MQLYYGHLHAQYIQVMEFTYDIWYLMNRNQQSYSKLSPTIQKKWCIILSQLYLHDAKPTEVLRAQIDFIMDVLTTSHYEDLIKSPGNNHRIIAFFYKMILKKKKIPRWKFSKVIPTSACSCFASEHRRSKSYVSKMLT